MNNNRGSYVLLLYLEEKTEIDTGAKTWSFEPGYYIYVGSAMNSLTERVRRHMASEKKMHWHIDYLREKARIAAALLIPSETRLEEEISVLASDFGEAVKGFGSSDCKTDTNLYRIQEHQIGRLFGLITDKWRDKDDSFFE